MGHFSPQMLGHCAHLQLSGKFRCRELPALRVGWEQAQVCVNAEIAQSVGLQAASSVLEFASIKKFLRHFQDGCDFLFVADDNSNSSLVSERFVGEMRF